MAHFEAVVCLEHCERQWVTSLFDLAFAEPFAQRNL